MSRDKRPGQKLAATIFEAVRNQSNKREETTDKFNLEKKPTLKALLQKNLEDKKEEVVEMFTNPLRDEKVATSSEVVIDIPTTEVKKD